ncbi:MAG: sigma-54-dependent Fis family transcriptional regulator [Candidatus Marinimicrobia bacterium]|nr:sigma-54-dependent Fis family transcriptional regulator [Candidatus Neomarinimicrobiota bacterium]
MNILIVDDERNIRLTLKDILEDEGYQIQLASTGEIALNLADKSQFDLVILDVKLPGMDGLSVLTELLKKQPGLDVLMISGHGTIQTAVEALKIGAYDFCEKPLSMAKILAAAKNIKHKQILEKRIEQGTDALEEKYRLVGSSNEMEHLQAIIKKVAPTGSKVLIRGESGTGKELVAFAIHNQSLVKDLPFIAFNSAAIPSELVESELFGHEKGAFTGADSRKLGKLELADNGTLFLDEIGDMSLNTQAKILRAIQEGTFERVGGNKTIKINTRIIAATHKNLEAMVKEGSFREDLFYRLNVIPINIPPLRQRPTDIVDLAKYFLSYFASELNLPPKTMNKQCYTLLKRYPFPGNVRELKNLIERLYILVTDDKIYPEDISLHLPETGPKSKSGVQISAETFKEARIEFERQFLKEQLDKMDWHISTVAEKIGLHQPNLSRKIKDLGLEKTARDINARNE